MLFQETDIGHGLLLLNAVYRLCTHEREALTEAHAFVRAVISLAESQWLACAERPRPSWSGSRVWP